CGDTERRGGSNVSGRMVRVLGVLTVIVAAFASGSCGYTLAGRGSFLPDSIRTIGIPNFGNRTPYLEVEQVLTQRVRSEFIGRGKYKVQPQAEGVDAVLRAEITSIAITPASFNAEQQADRYTISVVVSAQLVEANTDNVLWQNPNQVFREEYALATGAASSLDPAAFFGQASNAVDRMARDFAQALVSAILEAF
ncbi:MAG TPA: LPS assembly lipoprotein LptE, partial [Vicinamibacterales bacterium]|nr:LPS assembly lipoprotein LptE [Vicinamibacterales bacterium]